MTKINKLPEYAREYKYVVARESDDEMWWFYAAYDDIHTAQAIAKRIGGEVFETDGCN